MKRKILVIIYLATIAIAITGAFNCSTDPDFTGNYNLTQGNCSSKRILLKRVLGFGEKYYLIYLFKQQDTAAEAREFLGVIDKKNRYRLIIYSGTRLNRQTMKIEGFIIVSGNLLSVQTADKTCTYTRDRPGEL